MCGMPYHAAQGYIAKLIKAGRRVAICDQTSEPQPGKIVTRDITQIISAGTISDLDLLESKRANYLGAIYSSDGIVWLAYADLSTGEFHLTAGRDDSARLLDELARVSPAELLISDQQATSFGDSIRTLAYDQLRVPAGASRLHPVRAFQGEITRWLWLLGAMPAGGRRGGRDCSLSEASTAAEDRSSHCRCAAMAPADHVVLDARDASQPRTGQLARRTRHEPAAPRSIAPSPRWADGVCGTGSCNPCAILTELECRQQLIADLLQEPDLLASLRERLERRCAISSARSAG